MKIAFIGAGKVGQSLAIYLKKHRFELVGFYARKPMALKLDERLIEAQVTDDLNELIGQADIIGITVSDDQIDTVITQIINEGIATESKAFFHTSGVHSVNGLNQLSNHVFTLHPLRAFTSIVENTDELLKVYYGIENESIMRDLGLDLLFPLRINVDGSSKAQYHASAVIASNYLVTVVNLAINQLMALGYTAEVSQNALWPLIINTIANIEKVGAKSALTGPIARGDSGTIKMHLNALSQKDRETYIALARQTISLSNHSELKKDEIISVLEEDDYDKDHNINFFKPQNES